MPRKPTPKPVALSAAPVAGQHPPDVSEIIGELDRQITRTLHHLGRTRKPDLEGILDTAERVRRLVDAKDIFVRFGYRMRLSKGAEVAETC